MRSPRPVRVPIAAVVTAALLGWACASAPRPRQTAPIGAPESPSCPVSTDSVGLPRTVAVVFADSLEAEPARLADSLPTPVRFDCPGRAIPDLATAWSRDSSGTYWTLEFGSRTQTSGGDELTAARVADAWRTDSGAAAALESAGARSMLPLDGRRLAVGFSSPHQDIPTVFADPSLGLRRGETASGRLLATAPGGDPRDALDRGADVVVGRDPGLLDYARRRPDFVAVPLPWSRSYVLVLPPAGSLEDVIPADTTAFRTALARDAVRAEARAAVPPFWWDVGSGCRRSSGRPPQPSPLPSSDIIAYQEGDASARELAERLVALADTERLTARGYPADDFTAALRAGRERAYVVALPAHPYLPCRETADWPAGSTGIGLVETRSHAFVRRGTPPLVVDWDGTLHAAESSVPEPLSP